MGSADLLSRSLHGMRANREGIEMGPNFGELDGSGALVLSESRGMREAIVVVDRAKRRGQNWESFMVMDFLGAVEFQGGIEVGIGHERDCCRIRLLYKGVLSSSGSSEALSFELP